MKKTVSAIGMGFAKLFKLVFRIIVFLVLLVGLGLATAAWLVQHYVSEEALKVIITAQLQDVFHRPVEIQGVKFNVYQGIRVQGFQVRESPEFSGGYVITSDYLLAKYKWKALLHKRLEFEQIQVVAPHIQVLRSADGRWNWGDILISSTARHQEIDISKFSLPVDLFAHIITIEHGIVTVKDLRRDRQYNFQSVDLSLQDFDLDKPFTVNASFENDQAFWNQQVHSAVTLKGTVSLASLRFDQAEFRTKQMEIHTGGKTVKATLALKNFLHPEIETDLRMPHMDSVFLSQYHPVPNELSVPASRWIARFSFPEEYQFQLNSLNVTAGAIRLQAKGYLGFAKEAKPFRIAWQFPNISLQDATDVWAGFARYDLTGRIYGSGELVGNFIDLEHTLAVEKVELTLHDFGGFFFKNQRLTHIDAKVSGTRNFETLSVAVEQGALATYGNFFSDINCVASIHAGDLEFQHLNATWDISHFQLQGNIRRLSAPREIVVEGSVDKIRLDAAIDAFEKLLDQIRASHPDAQRTRAQRLWSQVFKYSIPRSFPATLGLLKVGEVTYPHFHTSNLELQWELRGISTGLRHANGNIRIGFGPGNVDDIPALEDQDPHNILRVVFLPFVFMHRLNNLAVISAATAYPKSMDFNKIYGDYGLKQGVANVRIFHVDSPELLASADGKVDFPKERVNLHILERLTHSRGALPEYLSDEQGRPSIGFYVEGDLNNPTPRIEYRKMSPDAIEKALQAGLERGKKIFARIKEAL